MPVGWKLVPEKMTLAMLAASKNAMKEYIERMPAEKRRKRSGGIHVQVNVKHQIRYAAAIAAAPKYDESE